MNLSNILSQTGFDQVLLTAGAESARNVGLQVGRMASKSGNDPMAPEVKVIKSALIGGFMTGYFKREDGTMNWGVIAIPALIIVGLVILIRKI